MSDILNGDFPEPLSTQEKYLQTIINNQLGNDANVDNLPEPRSRQEEYLQAIAKLLANGESGSAKDGVTFTPSVSSEGVISWTNDGGLDNPESVNIKGPKGDTGAKGATGATGAQGPQGAKGDAFTYDDFTEEQLAGLKGEKGATGSTGPQGLKGDTGATITAISLTTDSAGVITGGTATLSDDTTVPITITITE